MRAALTETLVGHGYRVATEADGAAGLERACTEDFDLILLDVMMPHLDGFAVCRELRRRKREIAVLMLTARGLVDDRVTGLEAGADDYLIKPFSMKELLRKRLRPTPSTVQNIIPCLPANPQARMERPTVPP